MNRSAIAGLASGLSHFALQAAQSPDSSVISSFDATPVRIPFNDSVPREHSAWIVKLQTATGITGLAETRQDPRQELERISSRPIWNYLHRNLNGVECAIYDIAAQIAGLPLARLLSSTARTRLPVGRRHFSLKNLKEELEGGKSQGVNTHVVTFDGLRHLYAVDLSDGQLVIDGQEDLGGVAGALKSIENVRERFPVAAVLDPLRQTDLMAYRELRRRLPERLVLRWNPAHARNFLMEALADAFLVNPFSLYSSEAGICELANLGSWLEVLPNSGILSAYRLHQAAAVPFLELVIMPEQSAERVVLDFPAISSGVIELRERPGLGIKLDEAAIQRFKSS